MNEPAKDNPIKALRDKAEYHLAEYNRIKGLLDDIDREIGQLIQSVSTTREAATQNVVSPPVTRTYVRPPTLSRRPTEFKSRAEAIQKMNEVRKWVIGQMEKKGFIFREDVNTAFPDVTPKAIANMLWRHFNYDKDTNKWTIRPRKAVKDMS